MIQSVPSFSLVHNEWRQWLGSITRGSPIIQFNKQSYLTTLYIPYMYLTARVMMFESTLLRKLSERITKSVLTVFSVVRS
jgi:hypothetical protein